MAIIGGGALGVSLVAFAACTMVGAGSASAASGLHGTITVSHSSGRVGVGIDEPTYVSADAAALRECDIYDCRIEVRFVDACAAVARGADGRIASVIAGSRDEAERQAVEGLGDSAPPFPDLGSAAPRAANVIAASCTSNAG
ncbi:DUF4189 domain-containing protein [Nocardia callitridis]|uniref:DUF4189 domain-containing protein n=1 Tax=Nocardia callitridis TaxID=648753 RepID=A0ABP9KBF6_9NOCA